MDSARNGGICRRFMNGSCRFGTRCYYRHEWPALIPSSQTPCRYFQKGGCWFGERCKYLHVPQPAAAAAVAGRRGSVPAVSSSGVAPPDRRASEPALLQAGVTPRWESNRSETVASDPQQDVEQLPPNITEEQSEEADSESAQSSDVVEEGACRGQDEETSSSESSSEDGAAAACSAVEEDATAAFLQSENMTCGICMDKVYEKPELKDRVFALLPNCNHSFCLQCIMTWRKTRDLGPDVVKSCPQCRVRSPFYVPNKYWVEGRAKETIIAAFKDKFSKKSCSYYARYRRCPFKTECLYRHDKHAHHSLFPYTTEDEDEDEDEGVDLLNFLLAMTLLRDGVIYDEDEDFDWPFYLSGEFGF